LLFLICTVICSVIMVAATTASGRLAAIAETDQRYYSVTSAAMLLRDVINDETVTIVEQREYKENVTYENGVEISVEREGTPSIAGAYIQKGTFRNINDTKNNGIKIRDKDGFVSGAEFDSIPMLAAYQYYRNDLVEKNLSLSSANLQDLDVDIIERLAAGNLILTVKNPGEFNSSYMLQLTFLSDENEDVDEVSPDAPNDLPDDGSVMRSRKIEETRVITLSWHLNDIQQYAYP
ncbi:MAG: hypothetical protein IJ679_07750, partial [Lachnospiraceae bacterium]|nr:hypothetical protein [Lachnospiraceae bacterium]